MKSIKKLSFIAAIAAVISATSAFADNPRLENHLIRHRIELAKGGKTTEIAFGGHPTQAMQPKVSFKLRYDAHGQTSGAYTAVE